MEDTVNKNTAILLQLSALTQYFIPLGNYIIPTVIWSTQKERSKFVDYNGRQLINFQLSLLLYYLILGVTSITEEGGKKVVEGNLTLKDVTKNVKFPATINVTDNAVDITSETFTINRTLWNVNYSSKSVFDDLGNKYMDKWSEVKVTIKATK